MRHGSTIIITGTDAYEVAKDYVNYKISIDDFNVLLHGNPSIKTATLTLHGLVHFLETVFGLKIIRKSLEDYNYVIEAQRQ